MHPKYMNMIDLSSHVFIDFYDNLSSYTTYTSQPNRINSSFESEPHLLSLVEFLTHFK